ncbi:MAG: PA2778 family cysteine peptidase [Pseudomonadales bacterium]|jgi:hypothetical protein|nr:PA2778 family cysteine peptidase [Pseudomonadales bacterium]
MLLLALCLLPGCAARAPELAAGPSVELTSVPFHPQQRWQCGPAALATVLGASGLPVTAESLVQEVWVPGRRGTLAAELLGATRRHGRIPWRISPSLTALRQELEAGRPVLVFQNLGIGALPRWHYAVVVGLDADRGEVLLRSGTERLRRTPLRLFDRTWARSGRWAMVVLRGEERPANVERGGWFRTLAAVEEAGAVATAHAAWDSWLGDHPSDASARFGRAATAARLGDLATAAEDYAWLLAERGEDVRVLNNLALVRARQGCHARAGDLLARAFAVADTGALSVLQRSRTDLATRAARDDPPARTCPLRRP